MNSLSIIPEGYLPVPDLRAVAFWNTHVLDALPLLLALGYRRGARLALVALSSLVAGAAARGARAVPARIRRDALRHLFFWVGQLRHTGRSSCSS